MVSVKQQQHFVPPQELLQLHIPPVTLPGGFVTAGKHTFCFFTIFMRLGFTAEDQMLFVRVSGERYSMNEAFALPGMRELTIL